VNIAVILAGIGLGLMVGLSGTGSAIGLVIGGTSVIGAVKKKPEAFGSSLVLSALPATQGLYGFVAFILFSGYVTPEMTVFQGALTLGAGVAMGLATLFSAVQQGKVCAAGISAMGSGHDVFGNTFILAVFPEFYAILALVVSILITGLM
jgi:V/A-type H+-transporting ATPase subunit K